MTPQLRPRGTTRVSALSSREDAQTLVEYAVILAGIAVLLLLAVIFVGGELRGEFDDGGTSPLRPPVVQCDPNYGGGCVPSYPPDVDCSDLEKLGIGQVTILGSDPHNLDPDGDGFGCN